MKQNTSMAYAITLSAMLLASSLGMLVNSVPRMAFAEDATTENGVDDSIHVTATSSDGSLTVNIDSKKPQVDERLPVNVYFTDAEGAEVQSVHYTLEVWQDNSTLLSLPHVFQNKGEVKFRTPVLASEDTVYVQMTILGIGLPYDKSNWTGPIGEVLDLQIGQPPNPQILTVWSDQTTYHAGDTATVYANLAGYGAGYLIGMTITNPSGETIVSRTMTTDENGDGYTQFKIPINYSSGAYEIVATAAMDSETLQATAQFTIESQVEPFVIVSVQPTDQNGNPVSSFTKGSTGYAKVVVLAATEQTALLTVNLFDSNYVSLGVGSIKTTIGAGQSETIVSFFVPDHAVTGTGTIFANAFTDWPSNGGIPLTGEASTSVDVQ